MEVTARTFEKANPRRARTAEEEKRFSKLEALADKLESVENVQSVSEAARLFHTNYNAVVNN